MELREEREKTHLLQQQLEELQEDLNCTRCSAAPVDRCSSVWSDLDPQQ